MHTMEQRAYTLLVSLFVGGLVIAAVVSCKIVNVFGMSVPAGVLAYSITFAVSDIISEVWGKKRAQELVLCGFAALGTSILLSSLALTWPAAPFWNGQESFALVFGVTPRIVAASLIAYAISQNHDVWLFHFLRKRSNGKHLWVRNNVSTIISQLLDSVIFVTVAFYGELPVLPVILGQWTVKVAIALLDTPVVYAGVGILRGHILGKPEPAV